MDRTYTPHDVLAVMKRRKALGLAVTGAALAVGIVVALAIPSEWSATSVVQIEPRRLPADFFPAQSVTSFEERMRTVKHGVLARPVLERVIRETDYAPNLRDDMDEAVSRLRRSIEVRLEGEVAGGPPGLLFVVEVRGKDRDKVAKAADLLPRVYAEMTREVLAAQARSLRETLEKQAAALGKTLSEHEGRILAFKLAHQTELPETVETNARAMSRVQALMDMRLGAVADARRRRADLLAMIPEALSVPGMAETGLDVAQRKLEAARAAYSPDHPDVKRAEREYQEALARRNAELARYRTERMDEQLKRIDGEVAEHKAAIAELRKELDGYQERVEKAPGRGQELAALSRDYDVLKAKYVSTVSRRADATAAEQLLAVDAPSMFRMIEAPVTPNGPSAPDRFRLFALALLASIAAGLGAAGIAEWLDPSLRGPEDAGALGVPVLAAVPRIVPRQGRGS
jgi:polysaccharide biosynthesis transport protein